MINKYQNKALEESIIAYILFSDDFNISILNPRYFYFKNHKAIIEAILKLQTKDPIIVAHELKLHVSELMNFSEDVYRGEYYINSRLKLLQELYIKRCLNSLTLTIQKKIDLPSEDLQEIILKSLNKIHDIKAIDNGSIVDASNEYDLSKSYPKLPTQFKSLNEIMLGGITGGGYIVVGSRTGAGKTTFCIDMAVHQVLEEKRVLYFSTELKRFANFSRFTNCIRSYKGFSIYTFEQIQQQLIENNDLKLYTEYKTFEQIKFETLNQIDSLGVDLVVVDQLHNMKGPHKNALDNYAYNIDKLYEFAQEYNLRMLVASQLNRASANRMVSADTLGFKGASQIEDNADLALVLERDKENDITKLVVQKNRYGGGEPIIPLKFMPGGRFIEVDNTQFVESTFRLGS